MLNVRRKCVRAVLAACAGAALMPAVTLAQPVNNTCAGIITVATPSSTTATNVGATGTNLTSCADAGDINDVWFRFVAPSNAGYQFDTEGTVGMDTTLGLFSACESNELASRSSNTPSPADRKSSSASRAGTGRRTPSVSTSLAERLPRPRPRTTFAKARPASPRSLW